MFSRQKYTHSPCDIITLSIRVYFQMSGTCPEECHTTSGRILDEEARVGLTTQAILRLLIKTRQCCQPLDSNRMFSSRCRWRLLQENCWTNHKQLPFLFSRRMRQIDFLPLCVFIAISFAFCSSTSASRCVSPAIMVTEGDGGYPECIMRLCIYTGIIFTYGEPLIFRKYL